MQKFETGAWAVIDTQTQLPPSPRMYLSRSTVTKIMDGFRFKSCNCYVDHIPNIIYEIRNIQKHMELFEQNMLLKSAAYLFRFGKS